MPTLVSSVINDQRDLGEMTGFELSLGIISNDIPVHRHGIIEVSVCVVAGLEAGLISLGGGVRQLLVREVSQTTQRRAVRRCEQLGVLVISDRFVLERDPTLIFYREGMSVSAIVNGVSAARAIPAIPAWKGGFSSPP